MSWLNEAEVTTVADKEAAKLAQAKADAQQYLDDTDWYVTRYAETGKPIPEDVTAKRAECRAML